ncbi:MAG: hypothetical protein BROFUL_00556 [Candidatus Brocadia fulgida]|uniref:Uncharacterized protein n=1 Tax=Candidatus Brocadia fulgida TaxID=380242 RepID=A0A0M2UYQ0_9BACT|nr:MAG: hypothetical protein BROFUL_00556 [Candidatus Brocadia fulgida]MBV6519225.1 hypothetical protein [Candidatus Brocadia fulgida]
MQIYRVRVLFVLSWDGWITCRTVISWLEILRPFHSIRMTPFVILSEAKNLI